MVLAEDIAALTGLLLALTAVLITLISGNPLYAALGSVAVGVLLILVAVLLVVEIKGMITGQSAAADVVAQLRSFVREQPEVGEIFNLITLQHGEAVILAVEARMQEELSAPRLLEDINRVEARVRAAFPQVRWLFFEPDLHN